MFLLSSRANVQGWSADEVGDDEDTTCETVTCLACRQVHFVSRSTRKVLGSDDG
jgi:hypothetical protein